MGSPDDQAGDMDGRFLVVGGVGSGESVSEWVSIEELSVVKRGRGGERGPSCGCAMARIDDRSVRAFDFRSVACFYTLASLTVI